MTLNRRRHLIINRTAHTTAHAPQVKHTHVAARTRRDQLVARPVHAHLEHEHAVLVDEGHRGSGAPHVKQLDGAVAEAGHGAVAVRAQTRHTAADVRLVVCVELAAHVPRADVARVAGTHQSLARLVPLDDQARLLLRRAPLLTVAKGGERGDQAVRPVSQKEKLIRNNLINSSRDRDF